MIDTLLRLALNVGTSSPAAVSAAAAATTPPAAAHTGAAALLPEGSAHAPRIVFCVANCSLTYLDFLPGHSVRVIRVNDVRHLAPAPPHTHRHCGGGAVAVAGGGGLLAEGGIDAASLITGTPL